MEPYRHSGTIMTHFNVLHPSSLNMTSVNPPSTISTPPPNVSSDSSKQLGLANNTFVHKLYNMVLDDQYQHLIAWNYIGTSFIVCNIMEFSKDVLPKHFKHNNFSSFVRQLNMYGFHKINKSPRGHRTSTENQIWEFSHTKFLRNRTDLLGDIKRKAMESDTKQQGDIQAHLNIMQMSQSDMIQQINHLYTQLDRVMKDLAESKKKQLSHATTIKQLAHHISQKNGGRLPGEINLDGLSLEPNDNHPAPSIFVTSHESSPTPSSSSNISAPQPQLHHQYQQQQSFRLDRYSSPPSPSPLTVRTQNLLPHTTTSTYHQQKQHYHQPHTSMAGLSPLSTTFAHSASSTPTGLMASDDDTSLYSPRTPTDTSNSTNTTHYGMTLLQQHQPK